MAWEMGSQILKVLKGYKTFRLRFSKRLYIASFICIYKVYIYMFLSDL